MHPCEEKKDGCKEFLTLPRILAFTMSWSLIPAKGLASEVSNGCVVRSKSKVFSVPFGSRLVGKSTIWVRWFSSISYQWQPGGQVGRVWHFPTGNFCWEKRGEEKRENGNEEKGNKKKMKVENWKWKEDKFQNEERTFFFFLLLLLLLL